MCSRAPSAMTKWFRWLLMGILASAGAWWTLFVNEYVPGPERAVLMLEEVWEGQPQAVDGRFRIVLCWLDNDPRGHNTRYVAQAFTSVEGVTLVRASKIVKGSGAAEDWREAMQKDARAVLEKRAGDLAVVGLP